MTKCLNKYNLKDLSTLRDLSAVKQIEEIQKNLVVVQNWPEVKRNDGLLSYDLEYFSTNPRDAQAVLATIISTYEKHLDRQIYVFNTTRRAYRGRQVWPVLAVILPVSALIGAVVGLGFAYLSVFVVRATR